MSHRLSLSSVTYLLAGNLELNCGHGSLIRNKKTCIKNVMQYFLHMFDRYRHAIKNKPILTLAWLKAELRER
jgi:hypothetical protein